MERIANFSKNLASFKQEMKHFSSYLKESRVAHKADFKEYLKTKKYSDSHKTVFKMKWASIWNVDDLEYSFKKDTINRRHWWNTCGFHRGSELRYVYRHMHIAYSLVRGKTLSQIENKIHEGNQPDMELIERIIEDYMGIKDFFKNMMTFRNEQPRVIKMYVLVREDMIPVNRTVQGGHAVAEYLLNHEPKAKKSDSTFPVKWDNGYMIYLGVKDEDELNKWEAKLQAANKTFSTFVEPDWGEPTKTALACVDFGEIFNDLPLMSLEDNDSKSDDVLVTNHTVVK